MDRHSLIVGSERHGWFCRIESDGMSVRYEVINRIFCHEVRQVHQRCGKNLADVDLVRAIIVLQNGRATHQAIRRLSDTIFQNL